MSFEKNSNNFSNRMLEIVLIIVLLLNYFQIILIKLLIFVLGLSLILRKLIVLYNSLI